MSRLLLVLAGIVAGQIILYGPSLAGRKILLPLDILAGNGIYLPQTPEVRAIPIENIYLTDLVYVAEPARHFTALEFRAGRLPLWAPFQYAGAPLLAPKFSPILGLQYLTPSPVIIAWAQMLAALVAGFGAYAFCRRALGLSFWPSAVAAWCYPLTAYFIFWQGYYNAAPVCWLPWMLLAVEKTVRPHPGPLPQEREGVATASSQPSTLNPQPATAAAPALALATAATLLSGAVDIAAQVLLASGLYGLWCLVEQFGRAGRREERGRAVPAPLWCLFERFRGAGVVSRAVKAASSLSAAWVLGFLIAAPYVLPLVEYSQTGARMAERAAGSEERPPAGLRAVPQVVLPDMYGAFGMMKTGSFRFTNDSQQESSAAAYAGLVATLFFAPLAWCDPRRRRHAFALAALALLALSWSFNIPGLVSLWRMPGLNMLSHNRFVFLAAFALVALAATGLEVFLRGEIQWRRWFWLPVAAVVVLYGFCCYRALNVPEPIATQLELAIQTGRQAGWIRNVESVRVVQDWFVRQYTAGAILCGIALAGWVIIWLRKSWQARLFAPLAVALAGELLWFGYGRNVQASPALYFPKVPALAQLAAAASQPSTPNPQPSSASSRVIGVKCLPATLSVMCGLNDVRGYDGVDPAAYVELLQLTADPSMPPLPYAMVQWLSPRYSFTPEGHVRLSPILDMLGVGHVVFRGQPPAEAKPFATSEDYWIANNPKALPRAFVPERVEAVPDRVERLRRLGSPDFDPRKVAFTEVPLALPASCRGAVELAFAAPSPGGEGRGEGVAVLNPQPSTHVRLSLRMETPGLVVLADHWDKGWRALLNGQAVPILRVNHALRGVVVPAGSGSLEFRYEPASFAWGLRLAAAGLLCASLWLVFPSVKGATRSTDSTPSPGCS